MITVHIRVARSESTSRMPILANIAVSASNTAESIAQKTQLCAVTMVFVPLSKSKNSEILPYCLSQNSMATVGRSHNLMSFPQRQ